MVEPTSNDSADVAPSAHPLVDRIETSTPDEFIDMLRRAVSNEIVGAFPGSLSVYCFRGVSDARFDLVPRALRKSTGRTELRKFAVPAAFHEISQLSPDGLNRERVIQFHLEFGVLVAFCRLVQQSGLPLPSFDYAFSDLLRDPNSLKAFLKSSLRRAGGGIVHDWPPVEWLPLLALAQHYGLPTRLLDWTHDLHTAAYFAASGVVNEWVGDDFTRASDRRGSLAVWILPESAAGLVKTEYPNRAEGPLFMPMPPYSENPNLQAQRGVFTVWRSSDNNLFDARALPDLIQEWSQTHRKESDRQLAFKRIELPKREAPRLLDLLARLGWDASRLFPGYGGAARALKEAAKVDLLLKRLPERFA